MTNGDTGGTAAIIILVVFLLVPFGLVLLSAPAEPYSVVTGERVRDAAAAAGFHVINATEVQWPVRGALGGTTYLLADDAGHELVVRTQRFDSEESRDAVIRAYHGSVPGRGKPAGFLIVRGEELISVVPDREGLVSRIGQELAARSGA
jgi:hypothetical protein